jgi:TM2 domain-containing membrane protein YozV
VARTRKNPWTAAALAVIPGCGHFYLGHNLKGIALLVGIGGFQLFDTSLDLTGIGALVGVPLEIGPAGLWLYSIVDAYRTAKRMEGDLPAGA